MQWYSAARAAARLCAGYHLLTLAASLARPEEAFHHCDLVQPAQNEKRDRQADHEISTAQAVEFRPRDSAANEIDRKRNAQKGENENDQAERLYDDRFVKMQPRSVGDTRRQPATRTGNSCEMQKRARRQPQLPVSAESICGRPEKSRDKQQRG